MIQISAFFVGDDDNLFYEQIINSWNDRIIWEENGESIGRIQVDEDEFEYVDVVSITISDKQTFYENKEDADLELDYQGYDYAINEDIGRIFAKTPGTSMYKLTPLRISNVFNHEEGYRDGNSYFQSHNKLQSVILINTIAFSNVYEYGIVEAILTNFDEEYDYENIEIVAQNLAKDQLVSVQFIVDGGDETIYDLYDIEDGNLIFIISGSQPFNVIPDANIYITVNENGIIYENGQLFNIINIMGYEDYELGMESLKDDENPFEILELFKNIFNLGKAVQFIQETLNVDNIVDSGSPYVPYDEIMKYRQIENVL